MTEPRHHFELRFLGPVQIHRDAEPVRGFESVKAIALLGYLAVREGAVSRARLAGLFWGEKSEQRAAGNLRRVLHNLGALLPGCLKIQRQDVQLVCSADGCWTDVAAFEQLAAQETPESLDAAAALYRDELLEGVSLRDSPELEAWLLGERERWHQKAARTLQALTRKHRAIGDRPGAMLWVQRLLALDPWDEEAHRQAMELMVLDGQRNAALAQFEICRRGLEEDLGVQPSAQTLALHASIRDGKPPPSQPAARQPVSPPYSPPFQRTPLFGRQQELRQIAEILDDPGCRLLSLVGPGGTGKSRLGLEAAHEAQEAFLHGACVVRLGAAADPGLLLASLAGALRFSFHGRDTPKVQLWSFLRDKDLLLVLDGFEASAEVLDLLADLLEATSRLKLLVTSRERLGLHGEWALPLQGLELPAEAAAGESGGSAVELFLHGARRVYPGFRARPHEMRAIAQVCRLVEGLPLALEMAAAWVRALSCEEIAAELQVGLDLLTSSLRDVPERHRSVRAVLDHTWERLPERERLALASLSVFPGGFRREAAQSVADVGLPVISALLDKALLQFDERGRYRMHELLRKLAAEKLGEQEPRVAREHSVYYLRWLCGLGPELVGPDPRGPLEAIEEEISNVRAAWTTAVRNAEVELLSPGAEALYQFFNLKGRTREGEELLRQAMALAGTAGAVAAARAGALCHRQDKDEEARSLLQSAAAAAAAADRADEAAFCLNHLGTIAWATGDYELSEALQREALERWQELGEGLGQARSLRELANVARTRGHYPEARELLSRSLRLYRDAGDAWGTASCLNHLGNVAFQGGQLDEAEEHYAESLALCRRFGDPWGISSALNNAGNVLHLRGEQTQARALYQESLALCEQMGDRGGVSRAAINLAAIEMALGRLPEALVQVRRGLEGYRLLGDRWGTAVALDNLGLTLLRLGRREEAEEALVEALALARELRALPLELDVVAALAEVAAARGDRDTAVTLARVVRSHVAAESQAREQAEQLLARLEAELATQAPDLEAIVERVLSPLPSLAAARAGRPAAAAPGPGQ